MQKVNIQAFAVTLGLVWGAVVALMAFTALFGWGDAFVALLSDIYVGYAPGPLGALIGFLWGAAEAAIGVLIIGWVYNRVSSALAKRAAATRTIAHA